MGNRAPVKDTAIKCYYDTLSLLFYNERILSKNDFFYTNRKREVSNMWKVKELSEKIVDSIKNFTNSPVESLGLLIPATMVIITVVSGLVGYIRFIVQGGYLNQVNLIKELGIGGILKGFTTGSSGILMSGSVAKVIWILFLIQMIVMLISYFLSAGKIKRIIMIVDLVVIGLLIIALFFVFPYEVGLLVFSEEQLISFYALFGEANLDFEVIRMTYAIVSIVPALVFLILIVISDCRWMLGYGVFNILANFIAMPLIVLVLENIIPLSLAGIVLLVVIVIFYIFSLGSATAGGGSSSSSRSGGYSSSYSTHSSPQLENHKSTVIEAKTAEKQFDRSQKKKEFNFNTTFWRDKGGNGVFIPLADCIYHKDTWGEKRYICTVDDFEKGEVAIFNNQERITLIAGCNTPKR